MVFSFLKAAFGSVLQFPGQILNHGLEFLRNPKKTLNRPAKDWFRTNPSILTEYTPGRDFQDYTRIYDDKQKAPIKDSTNKLCGDDVCEKGIRVYVDKDDTTLCSGGEFPKGMDDTCIKGAIYAGAYPFLSALLQSHAPTSDESKYIEITARPAELSGEFIENEVKKGKLRGNEINKIRNEKGFGGNLIEGFLSVVKSVGGNNNWLSVGATKVENLKTAEAQKDTKWKNKKYDHSVVWVGDDGQGDAWTGRAFQNKMLVSFIHRVNLDNKFPNELPEDLKSLRADSSGLVYFSSYPEAAHLAYTLDLITKIWYKNVLKETLNTKLGRACCKESYKKNIDDGTCGIRNCKNLNYGHKYCKDIRDAVEYAQEEKVDFTCEAAYL